MKNRIGSIYVIASNLCIVLAGAVSADSFTGLLEQSGVRGGVVVLMGCGDAKEMAELAAGPSFIVQGIDTDANLLTPAHEYLRPRQLCGPVSVSQFDGRRLPYVDRMVNLLVVAKPFSVDAGEMWRCVAPRGVICLATDADSNDIARKLVELGAEHAGEHPRWALYRKPWPDTLDEWPHSLHGSNNNPVADDEEVGPPKHLQWICGPRWSKHHEKYPPTIPVVVSSAGRVFYFEDTTPASVFNVRSRWWLVARDAFNGVLLWRRPASQWEPQIWPGNLGGGLSGGPVDYRRRLVAVGDRVYVTLNYHGPVMQLDAATGETLQIYEGTGGEATEIVYEDESLFVSHAGQRAGSFRVVRLNPETGQRLWEADGGHGMAIDEGRVLFIAGDRLGALNADTGKSLWNASPLEGMNRDAKDVRGRRVRLRLQGPLRAGAGVVLACPGGRGSVIALSAADGKRLWAFQNQGFRPFFRPVTAWIIDDLVWVTQEGQPGGEVADDYYAVALDPRTGEVRRRVPCGAVWNCGHHQRCYPTKGTSRFLIFSRRGAEFLNLNDGDVALNNWTRGTCGYGVMPANGLLYAPPHSCRCYSEAALRGLHVLAPDTRGPDMNTFPDSVPALVRGPAYATVPLVEGKASEPEDWPTLRHDAARSGSTTTEVSGAVAERWIKDFHTRITQPVVVADTLFVAATDQHTLHAVDAATGTTRWSYTTGGRIDTPPTYYRGMLLMGCRDGWVYCLRAEDGQLIWRFRAAPRDVRLGDDGQIESVWPVHGSVLVHNDVAYFAAGRGSFVDQGIWLYGLDPTTGEVLYRHHYEGPDTGAGFTRDNPGRGFVMPGALPDVLVADDHFVYMRHLAFDEQLKQARDMEPNFYAAPVRAGEEFGGDHKYWCDLLEVGPRAFVGHPEWDFRSYFNQFPGQRLYSTTGLLDHSWHIRSYWSYGQVVGQYLVFRGDRGCAALAYPNAARWASYQAGQGYLVYSGRTRQPKPGEQIYALKREERDWQVTLPIRPVAMLLAGEHLLVAGPPDLADPEEATAALEGNRGGKLYVLDAGDGRIVRTIELPRPPINEGVMAAGGRMFMVTAAGQLTCWK